MDKLCTNITVAPAYGVATNKLLSCEFAQYGSYCQYAYDNNLFLSGNFPTFTESTPMTGTKPIILALDAKVPEFDSRADAQAEAERRCAETDKGYIVYVPVLRVRPKKDLVVEEIPPAGA